MKRFTHNTAALVFSACLSVLSAASLAANDTGFNHSTIDSFDHQLNNSLGIPRQFFNDSMSGGGTSTTQTVANGAIHLTGDISPARGQPGWASTVFLLDAMGKPQDLSGYEGVVLKIRVDQGNVSISANSTDIVNFDYHSAPVIVAADGEFHEVKVPFGKMKRTWSQQTTLDKTTINSLSLVAFSPQPASFNLTVDEVGFY